MSLVSSNEAKLRHTFDSAEMGAIAHLYRGEVYRSTIWRTRLDNTTNWSVVTMGIALSTTFSSPEASPLPLLLVGLLIAVFVSRQLPADTIMLCMNASTISARSTERFAGC
jgi:uncharacterized membrane protein